MKMFKINNTIVEVTQYTSPELLDIAPAGVYRRDGFKNNFAIVLEAEKRTVLRLTKRELWTANALRTIDAVWIKINAVVTMNVLAE